MARSLRPLDVYPITTRFLEVLRVQDVTPGMRRVTLGGAGLAAHTAPNGFPVAAFRSDGVDDEFKIILKHPDLTEALGPTQADGVLSWPRDEKAIVRTYTVRRWDEAAGELDVDFVNHGVGPATSWANRVQIGEQVQIAGPKMSAGHPRGADWLLIAGDETALPAIGRWLEEWPAGTPAQVFIEIGAPADRQQLVVPDGVQVTWLSRDGATPGTTTLLLDAVRAAAWWPGKPFVWAAGEAVSLTPLRRWLRTEKQLPREQLDITGYWRRQEVLVSTEDPSMPDLAATETDTHRMHELTEVLPAFAVRVAVTVGLVDALSERALSLAETVEATGADRAGLPRLLRYLVSLEVLEQDERDRYLLAPLGRVLEEEHVAEELHLEQIHSHRTVAGALTLLSAVRTGRGDHDRWFGSSLAETVATDPRLLSSVLAHDAEEAGYVAGALAAAAELDGVASVTLAGRGCGVVADELVGRHPEVTVTIVAMPSELTALQQRHDAHPRIRHQPGSVLDVQAEPADAVLLVDLLGSLADDDAALVLRQAARNLGPDGRILVFGDVLDPAAADEHDYEADLVAFTLTGGGLRDQHQTAALVAAAGLQEVGRSTISWGYPLLALAPVLS